MELVLNKTQNVCLKCVFNGLKCLIILGWVKYYLFQCLLLSNISQRRVGRFTAGWFLPGGFYRSPKSMRMTSYSTVW